MTGDIMDISRLRMASDGDGVSTLVVMFGCPLRCKYCINDRCHDNKDNETPRGAYTPEELIAKLSKDDIYFKMTGGGVVFGGGEPLLQADFISEVCIKMDPLWKKRIETSLNVPWENIEKLLENMDEWIVDVKDMNPSIYQEYTSCANNQMIQNLKNLIAVIPPEKMRVRIPHILNYNTDDDVKKSVEKLRSMGVTRIDEFEYLQTESDRK